MDAADRKLVHCLEQSETTTVRAVKGRKEEGLKTKCSPSVVLSIQQEVRAHDGDAHRHDAEDDQHQHHESVHVVDFVGPK